MKHTVVYKQGGREIGREDMDGRLAETETYAQDAMGTGSYDAIDILDANGNLVRQYPRFLRKAP